MASPFSAKIVFLISLLLVSVSIVSVIGTGHARAQEENGNGSLSEMDFQYQRLYRETDLLYRAAFGDLIPGNGHVEMAACSKNGRITVTYGSDMTWTTETATRVYIDGNPNDPAQVYSIAVGDLYPEYDGDELFSVDMDYNLRMTRYQDGKWISRIIYRDIGTDWLYEIAIGEMVEEVEGPELVIVGESQRTVLLTRNGIGWDHELIFRDNFGLDTCFIDDVDPDVPGNEVLVGGIDSNLTMISGSPGNWTSRDIAYTGSAIIDVLTHDLDPDIPGNEIYASTFSGEIYMVHRSGDSFVMEMVHDEGAMAYGLEKGSVDGVPVVSMATWNSRVALLYHDGGGYRIKEAYREDFYLLGTGIHDIDPYHKGNEIIGLSALGYLTMIYHDDPGMDLKLPFNSTVVSVGDEIDVPLMIRRKGGYQGTASVNVMIDGTQDSVINVKEAGSYSVTLPSFDQPGSKRVSFDANWDGGSIQVPLVMDVIQDNRSVSLSESRMNGTVGADRQLVRSFSVLSNRDILSPLTFSGIGLPSGIDVELEPSTVDPLGDPVIVTATIRVQPETELTEHMFFIKGKNVEGMTRAIVFTVDVRKTSIADFDILIQSPSIDLRKGENSTFDVLVVSTGDFDSEVSLSIAEPVEDLDIQLSSISVIPTDSVSIKVEALEDDGPYFIHVRGVSGDLRREDIMRIDTQPPSPALGIDGGSDPVILVEEEDSYIGELELELVPLNGVIEDVSLSIDRGPDNLSVSASTEILSRIPYPVNITIQFSFPLNATVEPIILNFSSAEGHWTHEILLETPGSNEGDEDGMAIWPFIAIMTGVVVMGGIGVMLISGGNPFKSQEGDSVGDGVDRGNDRGRKTGQRHHGRGSGLDRMGRYRSRP